MSGSPGPTTDESRELPAGIDDEPSGRRRSGNAGRARRADGRVVAVDPEELGSAVLDEYLSSKGGE